ncbi:YeeE/YedE thiosulfate transporter family protein [Planctomycetota bacterium]
MNTLKAQTPILPWWTAGIILGLVQILAVSLVKPLEVSSIFVVVEGKILSTIAPEYAENHPVMNNEEYEYSGYNLWFNIGILLGACIAASNLKSWKIQSTTLWWSRNHHAPAMLRIIVSFCGGFLLLLGASIAYGGLTEHFASGLAQLSLSAVVFTIAMLGTGLLFAYYIYPTTPDELKGGV